MWLKNHCCSSSHLMTKAVVLYSVVCMILYQVHWLYRFHGSQKNIGILQTRRMMDNAFIYFSNNLNFVTKSSQNVILEVRDLRIVNEGMFWYKDSGFLRYCVVSSDIIYRHISASVSLSDCSTLNIKALRTRWHGVTYQKAWTLRNTAAITANHACFHLLVKPIKYFISRQT